MPVLSDADIDSNLAELAGWARDGEVIAKRYDLPNFVEAIAFVQRVAELAESAGHHPDIVINYNKVTLSLSTHDEGGITEKDFSAARSFDGAVG